VSAKRNAIVSAKRNAIVSAKRNALVSGWILVLALGATHAYGETQPAAIPAQLSATVVIEPPRIEVGDAFWVEIAVITPPDHRVPLAPIPKAIDGLWVLDAGRPELDRQAGRWVHHQRIRARARAVGEFRWPSVEVPIEAPDGSQHVLTVPPRPFSVVSLLAEHPTQRSFFSYREPQGDAKGRSSPWLPAIVGALFALGAVALISWVRRARNEEATRSPRDVRHSPNGDTPRALAALRNAAAAASDPVHAADLASLALREWAAHRGRDAGLRAATAEELAYRTAPPLLASRYEGFVSLVGELDALRFPPLGPDAEARARDTIGRTLSFVAGADPTP
jgi:hypothetical protein